MDTIIPQHEGEIGGLVPVESGRDYAKESKDQAKKLEITDELHKFFLHLFDIEKQNKSEWLDIKRQMVRARKYFDGKQYGYVSDSCQWVDYETRNSEVNYIDNSYHAHIMTAMMELSRGSVELNFSHIAKESSKGILISTLSEQLYKTHKRKLFDPLKLQQEILSKLLNGVALRYTFFRWNTDGDDKVPVFGEKDIEGGEEADVCSMCSSPMPGETCPTCGNDEHSKMSVPKGSAKVIERYEGSYSGENDWEYVDPLGVNFYLYAPSLKQSPYIIWKQAVLASVLQAQYKDVPIKEGITSTELNYQFETTGKTPNQQNGYLLDGSTNGKDMAEFAQGWFEPSLYANYTPQKDCVLRNGTVIKKGVPLGEQFPFGLYLAKNGNMVLDVWNEDKNRKWTAVPYVTRPGTLVGAGTSVALANQDIKNDLRNLHMASIMHDAFAKEFVQSQYLEGQQVPDSPTERAIVTNLPQGMKIVGNVIDRLPPTSLSPDAYAMEERIDSSMQMQLGTFSGSSAGAPDLKAVQDTASGFLAWRNMTVGRYAPMLAASADALDKVQAMQFLLNDQQYLTPKQWSKIAGDYGQEAVKAFLACDLEEELIIEVVGESYMPANSQDRQSKIAAFTQLIMEGQIDPHSELGAYIGSQFDMPKSLIGYDVQYNIANIAIEAFKVQADGILAELPDIPSFNLKDPTVYSIAQLVVEEAGVPIDSEMDDHGAMIEAMKDWWAKDQGRNASNVLKAAVLLRVEQHKEAALEKAQKDQAMAMAAQAPQMAVAEHMSAVEAQNQNPENTAQIEAEKEKTDKESAMREQEMMVRGLEKVVDSEDVDKRNQHEASESELQRKHDLKQNAHDLQMAKLKAKQTPKKAVQKK